MLVNTVLSVPFFFYNKDPQVLVLVLIVLLAVVVCFEALPPRSSLSSSPFLLWPAAQGGSPLAMTNDVPSVSRFKRDNYINPCPLADPGSAPLPQASSFLWSHRSLTPAHFQS